MPLQANAGWVVSVGVAVPIGESPALEVQGTLGWKGASEGDASYTVQYLSFPVELLLAWSRGHLRLAGGPTLVLAPTYHGSGQASALQVDRHNAPGALVQAEYLFGTPGSYARGGFSARAGWVHETTVGGGGSQDAFTWGLRLEVYL